MKPKANRRQRRATMTEFRARQCERREASPDGRLFGDAPNAKFPQYFLDYVRSKPVPTKENNSHEAKS